MRACGAFVLNGFLLIFEVLDSLFENPFKYYIIQGSCPSKCRGRPHTKGLSNYCEWFSTYNMLGKFYSNKSIYQQIFGDYTGETEQERLTVTCNEAQWCYYMRTFFQFSNQTSASKTPRRISF